MTSDIDTAMGLMPKPFVYETCFRRLYHRDYMRQLRKQSDYREKELAQQRAYRRELRVGAVMAKAGRFEDQPGVR